MARKQKIEWLKKKVKGRVVYLSDDTRFEIHCYKKGTFGFFSQGYKLHTFKTLAAAQTYGESS